MFENYQHRLTPNIEQLNLYIRLSWTYVLCGGYLIVSLNYYTDAVDDFVAVIFSLAR